jgi:hypothetical protein
MLPSSIRIYVWDQGPLDQEQPNPSPREKPRQLSAECSEKAGSA